MYCTGWWTWRNKKIKKINNSFPLPVPLLARAAAAAAVSIVAFSLRSVGGEETTANCRGGQYKPVPRGGQYEPVLCWSVRGCPLLVSTNLFPAGQYEAVPCWSGRACFPWWSVRACSPWWSVRGCSLLVSMSLFPTALGRRRDDGARVRDGRV